MNLVKVLPVAHKDKNVPTHEYYINIDIQIQYLWAILNEI